MELHSLTLDHDREGKSLSLNIYESHKPVLRGIIGQNLSTSLELSVRQPGDDCIEAEWKGVARVSISHVSLDHGAHQYNVSWTALTQKPLIDAYDLRDACWYGGAAMFEQRWPIENFQHPLKPFVCDDSYAGNYGGLQERYWLSSNGIAIFVEADIPLFVATNYKNNSGLVFESKFQSPYRNVHRGALTLNYVIFQAANIKDVHKIVMRNFLPKPCNIPDDLVFRYPVWSTWARFKKNINQDLIVKFADEILGHGFPVSQLEIDDDWTPAYGDMIFDPVKFPDPKKMMQDLENRALRVTLWVHPFCSLKSKAFFEQKGFWLSSFLGGMTTWWNGVGRYMDVTNPESREWFIGKLQSLKKEYGVTSFKFDAGEVNWMPRNANSHIPMLSPNEYTKLYAELAYSVDTDVRCQEVRVGWRTQKLPVFVRMMDKDSCWGYNNGLQTLIPHALTSGLLGYPFVLPDMIGGNAYKEALPERELYIRWLQITTFMPAMQFSIVPWQYDEQVVDIAKSMLELRSQWADYIITTAHHCVENGDPIIRPLWWICAPNDQDALRCDSQFMVGDLLLVAPVVTKNGTSRDIYLPAGVWHDELVDITIRGGQWLRDYPVKIEDLPHFTLERNENLEDQPAVLEETEDVGLGSPGSEGMVEMDDVKDLQDGGGGGGGPKSSMVEVHDDVKDADQKEDGEEEEEEEFEILEGLCRKDMATGQDKNLAAAKETKDEDVTTQKEVIEEIKDEPTNEDKEKGIDILIGSDDENKDENVTQNEPSV